MVLKSSVGMHIRWPLVLTQKRRPIPNRKKIFRKDLKYTHSTKENKKTAFKARAYHKAREDKNSDKTDLRWEAMKPVLDGRMPVFVHVTNIWHSVCSVRENIKIVIVGGSDAWRAVPLLKKNDIQ